MAIQMRRGNLADFDPTKQMPGEFAVTLDTDSNLNKRVYIAFAAGTVKQLMTVEDATAQMIEATDAASAEAEAWAHGNSFTATEMFTSAGSATVTLAYSPSSINAVKINDVATTAYTRNGKVITFNTAPAVGSTITVIYGVSTATDNAKYYKGQAANSASTASTKATQASTSATNAANSASTASTKATQAGNSATLSESYAVGGTGTRPGEDTDNAKYYKDQMANYLSGIYHFIGSVNSYADLPTMGMVRGDTYDILTADPTHEIAAGDNVAWTGTKWDKLAGIIAIMIGATASSNGAKGLVPAPMINDREKYLRGDGTWANPNTAVDDVYSVMGQMGAKNLIPYPYSKQSYDSRGIIFTVNEDGSCNYSGTANNTSPSYAVICNRWLKAGTYILSDGHNAESETVYGGVYLKFYDDAEKTNNYSGTKNGLVTYSDGSVFTQTTSSGDYIQTSNTTHKYGYDKTFTIGNDAYVEIQFRGATSVYPGTSVSGTIKPMLRLAADTDDSYQPYAKTNKELTNGIDDVYKTMGEMGAKNLFNSQYSVPRTNAETTATLGDDGHVIINGTANADAAQLKRPGTTIKPIKDLKVGDKLILSYKVISGTFTHGSSSAATSLYFNNKNGSAVDPIKFPSSLSAGDSDSKEIALTNECFTDGILDLKDIQIYMRSGDTFNNLELAIMLRLASDTDNTYQPYAKTNKQLTETIGDLTATGVTGDSVAEQLGSALSLLNGKADNVNLGEVNASTDIEALGAAWDTLNIYDKTVVAHFARFGKFEALMYKYGGSQYGMVIAMKYGSTDIYVLSVRGGTKYYATYSSESGTVTSTLFDTNRIAVTSQDIKYRKSGNIVTVYGDVTFGAKVTTSGNYINAGRLPFISSIQSIVSGKIVCDTGTTTPYEAVSKGGTNSIWFSYNGTNEMQTTYFENKKFHLYLTYVVS